MKVYLIRRFGSDRSPHQWYLLKSRKYKKDAVTNFTCFLWITKVLNVLYKKRVLDILNEKGKFGYILWCEAKCEELGLDH